MSKIPPIVVLGAGLQGSCIALELARSGQEVLLLDQDPIPMNRASLRNEGKIHLGLIYANDPSLATGALQLEGALRFRALLSRWIGPAADQLSLSAPFHYLVANDSVLDADQLEKHYTTVESLYREKLRESPDLDYLGGRPERLFKRLDPSRTRNFFVADRFRAEFETAELAIDPHQLAVLIRKAIESTSGLRFLPSRKVLAVERAGDIFRIEGTGGEAAFRIEAQQVINATWENRMAIDQTVGLHPSEGWLYRLKYRVIARVPPSLRSAPSATMVLGRYGDVVIRSDGTAYLSWYPAGLQGWSRDLKPPADWNAPCKGEADEATAQELIGSILSGTDAWFPGIGASEPLLVDAGAIVAHGRTDVDDPASGLHGRSRVGVVSRDGYHSVDPGKLTTAPLFAMEAAERVMSWNAVLRS
ncbi:FAD-binding oxidoreductase [Candidatus Sumerlaeota bacterium]|nr:FAD-binding oxidoreductase [Candidatus Sumerlaeota bacterium]